MTASRRILLLVLVILLLLLFLAVPGVSWADALEDAARNLARKIAAALPVKQSVAVEFEIRSTLTGAQVTQLRRAIESELTRLGHPVGVGALLIRLRISENLEDLILVAELSRDGVPAVRIAHVPKSAVPPSRDSGPTVSIQKEFVFEQPSLILDFEMIPPAQPYPERLFVLEREKLVTYVRKEKVWELSRRDPIAERRPWPRDLRGWMSMSGGGLKILLPGMKCETGPNAEVSLNCTGFADSGTSVSDISRFVELRGQLAAGRNYFPSWPSESHSFTAAQVPGKGWIDANVDGVARIHLVGAEPTLIASDWGSEIAGITSMCGGGRQILVTRSGDWTVSDAVQAYEIVEGQALAVGAPLEFSGPVMALWTAEDESYVRVVVRNLKTGHYEAYRLSITCGN